MHDFFKDCQTPEQAKRIFRRYAKKFHPDKNKGNSKDFIELKRQYDGYLKNFVENKAKDFDNEADYTEFLKSFFASNTTFTPLIDTILADVKVKNLINDKAKSIFDIITAVKNIFA